MIYGEPTRRMPTALTDSDGTTRISIAAIARASCAHRASIATAAPIATKPAPSARRSSRTTMLAGRLPKTVLARFSGNRGAHRS
jgi:hypothetical protein